MKRELHTDSGVLNSFGYWDANDYSIYFHKHYESLCISLVQPQEVLKASCRTASELMQISELVKINPVNFRH